jgi:hypothetical protein
MFYTIDADVVVSGNVNRRMQESLTDIKGLTYPERFTETLRGHGRYLGWGLLWRTFAFLSYCEFCFCLKLLSAIEAMCAHVSDKGDRNQGAVFVLFVSNTVNLVLLPFGGNFSHFGGTVLGWIVY